MSLFGIGVPFFVCSFIWLVSNCSRKSLNSSFSCPNSFCSFAFSSFYFWSFLVSLSISSLAPISSVLRTRVVMAAIIVAVLSFILPETVLFRFLERPAATNNCVVFSISVAAISLVAARLKYSPLSSCFSRHLSVA